MILIVVNRMRSSSVINRSKLNIKERKTKIYRGKSKPCRLKNLGLSSKRCTVGDVV